MEETLGADNVEVADTLYNLGTIQLQSGDKESARISFSRGTEIVVDKLGTSHPKYNKFVLSNSFE